MYDDAEAGRADCAMCVKHHQKRWAHHHHSHACVQAFDGCSCADEDDCVGETEILIRTHLHKNTNILQEEAHKD